MTAIVRLRDAAKRLENICPRYLQQIAADKLRPVAERRFPERTHERFPAFAKDTNNRWVISAAALDAHLRKRIRRIEPSL